MSASEAANGPRPEDILQRILHFVVQSLAKFKRVMLGRLGVGIGEGIYCSSTSIRKGYKGDVTHSIIADQWDYEIRIRQEDRNIATLKTYVNILWKIITDAEGERVNLFCLFLYSNSFTNCKHLIYISFRLYLE